MSRKLQNIVCWGLFGVLMATLVVAGGNTPTAWSLMTLAVLTLFAAQLVLSFWRPRPDGLEHLWAPGLLFLCVILWGLLQCVPWMPEAWAHPAWSRARAAFDAIETAKPIGLTPMISADPGEGAHVLMRFGAYAMVFWIALRSALQARRARAMLRAFALASSLFAIYGIVAWALGNNPVLGETGRAPLSSTFVNRNNYATFAGFGLLANLAMFFMVTQAAEESRSNPLVGFIESLVEGAWIWLLGAVLCAGALLLSQSRGGALATLIGVIVFLVSHRKPGGRQSRAPLIVVGIVLVLAVVSSAAGLIDRVISISNPDGRAAIYPRIIEAIGDRPWLGHGLGSFRDVFRAYVPQNAAFLEWDLAHNSYLENLFELGIPAAALLYLALALVGGQILRGLMRRRRERALLAFVLGCFIIGAVHSLFDFSLQMPGLAAVFAWILGLGYAQSFSESQLSSPSSVYEDERRSRRKRQKLWRKRVSRQ